MEKSQVAQENFEKLMLGNRRHQGLDPDQPDGTSSTLSVDCSIQQTPIASILSCSDSRVIPEVIFDAQPGDLFVARVAGNVADTSTIASIEYASYAFGVRVIFVLGHECCGAVEAALDTVNDRQVNFGYNLNQLLANIIPAINQPEENDLIKATKKNAVNAAKVLLAQSEILRKIDRDEGLLIIPAYYNLGTKAIEPIDLDSVAPKVLSKLH